MKEKWFRMFANCIIIDGFAESIIYDLQYGKLFPISKKHTELISILLSDSLTRLKIDFSNTDFNMLNEISRKLVESEIGFYTDNPNQFPAIDFNQWRSPHIITNSVLEIKDSETYDLKNTISQLDSLGCQAIQLRLHYMPEISVLEDIVTRSFDNTRIKQIELLIPNETGIDPLFWQRIIQSQSRIKRIIIYASDFEKIIKQEKASQSAKVIFLEKDIRIEHNENIRPGRFVPNIPLFCESQNHNTGLNKKLCITQNGDVKNYIDHSESFGNINTNSLELITNKKEFKKKWFISNDMIEKCKVCQFRYTCVSNSDIYEKDDKYFKVSDCKFDPFHNKWDNL